MITFNTYTSLYGDVILKLSDNAVSFVPADEANSDYQQYLAWLAEGNTPEEWQPES
jgi:hypothetical protein